MEFLGVVCEGWVTQRDGRMLTLTCAVRFDEAPVSAARREWASEGDQTEGGGRRIGIRRTSCRDESLHAYANHIQRWWLLGRRTRTSTSQFYLSKVRVTTTRGHFVTSPRPFESHSSSRLPITIALRDATFLLFCTVLGFNVAFPCGRKGNCTFPPF